MSPDAQVEILISALFDAQARQRVLAAFEAEWITADDALEVLTSLDLLEAPQA